MAQGFVARLGIRGPLRDSWPRDLWPGCHGLGDSWPGCHDLTAAARRLPPTILLFRFDLWGSLLLSAIEGPSPSHLLPFFARSAFFFSAPISVGNFVGYSSAISGVLFYNVRRFYFLNVEVSASL